MDNPMPRLPTGRGAVALCRAFAQIGEFDGHSNGGVSFVDI
jgi:hypothetical protein